VPDITVYIPAYSVAQFLPRAIASLLAQALAPAEIPVIDDGSKDDSPVIAQRVTVVRHERNSGLAAARNTAFRVTRGGFVASFEADCVAEPAWLEKLAARMNGELIYDPAAQATHLRSDSLQSILGPYWRRWKSGVNACASGISLRSVAGQALFVHFRHTFLELFNRDLRRRLALLPLDAGFLACLPYRDFRRWPLNGKLLNKQSAAGA
jgi:glycosyltransferase involved in cell wall biosynthesis